MLRIGARVRLLSQIGYYPSGTEATVVSIQGSTCEIEIDLGRRLTIDCDALALTEPDATSDSPSATVS